MFTVRRPFGDEPTIQAFAESARRLLPRFQSRVAGATQCQTAERPDEWQLLAEAGWLSVLVPEPLGGMGLDARHLFAVLYEEGRQPTRLPILTSALQAVVTLNACPPSPLRDDLLGRIARGGGSIGLAWQEQPGQLDAAQPRTAVRSEERGLRLHGTKRWVSPCAGARGWLVHAAQGDVSTIVWMPAGAPGVLRLPSSSIEDTDLGTLCFSGTPVESWQLLARGPAAREAVESANDWSRLGVACGLLGTASELLDCTVRYLQTRVQFNRPLGANQALQHRIVDQYIQVELALACVQHSVDAAAAQPDRLAAMASRAKARTAQTAVALGMEAIQMHGAMGYTRELPIGGLWKRALHMQSWLGSPEAHRRRYLATRGAEGSSRATDTVSLGMPEANAGEEATTAPEPVFRAWLRRFLQTNCPPELCNAGRRFRWKELRSWYGALGRAGLLAPAWPRQFGGMGLTADKIIAYHDEFETHGCPRLHDQGVTLVGPTLIRYGTPAQQQHYLPRILTGEHVWCQGYSEPNAGSDLASLKTRGTADGDSLVINGQKTWTTLAQDATHMFALVRTADRPKQQDGISFVLIDLGRPGVTIRPIANLAGEEEFCEVFLDNVRVPLTDVVGELHDGWRVGKSLLGFERLFNGSPRTCVRTLHQLQTLAGAQGLLESPAFLDVLAGLALDVDDLKALYMHFEDIARSGEPLPQSVSILKVFATETYTRIARVLADSAMEQAWEATAGHGGHPPLQALGPLLHAVATRIYGGSNEIQKNILAKRVLGLLT